MDGNRIGRRIHGLRAEELRAVSEALSRASRAAARRAVAVLVDVDQSDPVGHRSAGVLRLNGRPVVAGGDDFTLLVRGRAGLAVADAWLRAFEEGDR
jgi:hypothetical protein